MFTLSDQSREAYKKAFRLTASMSVSVATLPLDLGSKFWHATSDALSRKTDIKYNDLKKMLAGVCVRMSAFTEPKDYISAAQGFSELSDILCTQAKKYGAPAQLDKFCEALDKLQKSIISHGMLHPTNKIIMLPKSLVEALVSGLNPLNEMIETLNENIGKSGPEDYNIATPLLGISLLALAIREIGEKKSMAVGPESTFLHHVKIKMPRLFPYRDLISLENDAIHLMGGIKTGQIKCHPLDNVFRKPVLAHHAS